MLAAAGLVKAAASTPRANLREFQQSFGIDGRIVDSTGGPIGDVEISAIDIGTTTYSSGDGTFRLRLARGGSYFLRIRRIGFEARVVQVQVNGLVKLTAIRLRAAAQHLPEETVQAALPMPSFALRPSVFVMRRLHSRILYWTWATQGAALSPNALATIRYIEPGGPKLVTYGWYENISGSLGDFTISSGACPTMNDVPLTTSWVGLSDTVEMLFPTGDVWRQRRGHGLTTGPCLRRQRLNVADAIINAGPMLGGWLVVTKDSTKSARLSFHSAGVPQWNVLSPDFLSSDEALGLAHIAPSVLGATIAAPHWPFQWIELNGSGETRVSSKPFATSVDSARYAGWTALAVLPITNGFVQTLVSPGARDRRIVLYTMLGRPISITQGAGAPGLIASDLLRRKLLGLRFSSAGKNRAEVVEYEY